MVPVVAAGRGDSRRSSRSCCRFSGGPRSTCRGGGRGSARSPATWNGWRCLAGCGSATSACGLCGHGHFPAVWVRPSSVEFGPFLPTPTGLIDALLDVAEVGPDDVVADLGCGDGRVLVHAAARTRGCRAFGVDRDGELVGAGCRCGDRSRRGEPGERGRRRDRNLRRVRGVRRRAVPQRSGPARHRGQGCGVGSGPGARIVAHEQAPVSLTSGPVRAAVRSGGDHRGPPLGCGLNLAASRVRTPVRSGRGEPGRGARPRPRRRRSSPRRRGRFATSGCRRGTG